MSGKIKMRSVQSWWDKQTQWGEGSGHTLTLTLGKLVQEDPEIRLFCAAQLDTAQSTEAA